MNAVRADNRPTLRSMQRFLLIWRAEWEEGKMLVTSMLDAQHQDGRNFGSPGQLTLKRRDHGRQESYIDVRKVPNEAWRQPMGGSRVARFVAGH